MIEIIDLGFQGIPKAIGAYVVPDAEGVSLVECGPFSTHDNLLRGLKRLGYGPDDVHTVLLTHIHFDHAGAAWWWAERGAHVYVHPRGLNHMIDPSRLYGSAKQIYGDFMDQLWGRMEDIDPARITAVEDRQALTIGGQTWTAHHTPGHAKHHIAWQLEDSVFTGDVGGIRVNNGPVVPPFPPPDIDLTAWRNSIERLRELRAKRFYLTHFGPSDEIEEHLASLARRMELYAAWMAPHAAAGTPAEELVQPFAQFVDAELLESGLPESLLESYTIANPAYMSVTGLLRAYAKGLV